MPFIERRDWERVRYLAPPVPQLDVGGVSHDVADCSERGVRYLVGRGEAAGPAVGDDVRGLLRFPTGEEVEVEGVVVRREPGEIAVQFTTLWVPRDVMLSEKRRLRRLTG